VSFLEGETGFTRRGRIEEWELMRKNYANGVVEDGYFPRPCGILTVHLLGNATVSGFFTLPGASFDSGTR